MSPLPRPSASTPAPGRRPRTRAAADSQQLADRLGSPARSVQPLHEPRHPPSARTHAVVGQGLAHQLRPVGPASLPLRHEPGRAEGRTTLHVETLLELQRNPDEGPPLDAAGLHRSLPAVSDGQVDGVAQLVGRDPVSDVDIAWKSLQVLLAKVGTHRSQYLAVRPAQACQHVKDEVTVPR